MNFYNNPEDLEPEYKKYSDPTKRSIFYLSTTKGSEAFTILLRKEFCLFFDFYFPSFVKHSRHGCWKESKKYIDLNFLNFSLPLPEEIVNNHESLDIWAEFYKNLKWFNLGKNLPSHLFLGQGLDYCLAIDWRANPQKHDEYTELGNMVRCLKYGKQFLDETTQNKYFNLLLERLNSVYFYSFHQYYTAHGEDIIISPIPLEEQSKSKLAYRLAEQISIIYNRPLITPILLQPKPQMKERSIKDKIENWQIIFNSFHWNEDVMGKTICIIDDLYQSGASMWSYAKFLKEHGAKHVFGISCVKTLGDADNVRERP